MTNGDSPRAWRCGLVRSGVVILALAVSAVLIGCGRDGGIDSGEPGATGTTIPPKTAAGARVVVSSGDVWHWSGGSRPETPPRLDIGATVTAHSTVATGVASECELEFVTGATVGLAANTTISLTALPASATGSTNLRLISGSVMNRVGALVADQEYLIRARGSVVGVRGTEFSVSIVTEASTDVEWLEIAVSNGHVSLTAESVTELVQWIDSVAATPETAHLLSLAADTMLSLGTGESARLSLRGLEELEVSMNAVVNAVRDDEDLSEHGDRLRRELKTIQRFLSNEDTTTPSETPSAEPLSSRRTPSVESTDGQAPAETGAQEPELVLDVIPDRALVEIRPGVTAYTDSDIRILEYPDVLEGSLMVAQSNAIEDRDREDTAGYLIVHVGRRAVISVACEPVGEEHPAWIDTLGFTPVSATVRLEGGRLLEVFQRTVPGGGSVSLGGNRNGVSAGYHDYHYLVFVAEQPRPPAR